MKNKLLPLALALFGSAAYSQVGIGTLTPDDSSQLEVHATNKGVLLPRVALNSRADTTTITSGNTNSLLVYNTTDNDLIKPGFYYWYINRWEQLINSAILDERIGNDLDAISMVVLNGNLILTDIHGNTAQIPLADLNIVTTLVSNNNGTYTYTSEDGTTTVIDVPADVANYFETILNEGPITIGGVVYNTFEDYLTHVIKANETITTLVNNNNGTYTYVSEDGTVTLIDVVGDVATYFEDILNQGPIVVDGDTYNTFEEYLTTIIQSKETVTTLVSNNNGTYTYTSEDGTTTVIDVPADVANYFETILNEGPITIGGVVYNTFEDYLTHVIKANETITTLVNNNNGTYTYVSEDGTVTLIDVVGDVATYFEDILNQGPIVVDGDTYNTFEEYLTTIIQSKETVTTLVSNNNGTYTYTSEDGTTTVIDVPADVANYFETILNEGPITIGGVVYNTFEDYLTHVIKANETITTLVNNNNGTYTYVSEDGTVTLIDVVGDVATYFEDILNQGPIVVDGDTYNTFEEYLTTIIQSKETVTTLVSNNNGTYTYTSEDGTTTVIDVPADVANYFETILNEGPITIGGVVYNTFEDYLTHVIKANETITTLVNNNNGTYTYVSEDGTVTLIDVVGDVATYFEDILNQGPIVVDGDTYNTFEEYLTTIIQSKETVTTLVSNNNGTYTYTSEDGTTTVIDVPADVANYFETILNEGPITIGGVVYNTFEDYLTHVIKANETITTLVNNNNGTYTYVSEDGTVTLIDVVGDVATYFEDILNQGPIVVDGDTYNTFEEYLTTIIQSKETVTTLVSNNNGTYTYTSEDGTTTVIDVPADVANYFETILNEGPITIGGVVYNTFEDYLTHVIKANETITTLVNNNNGTYTYVSEDGTVTLIDVVGDVATYFEDILNQGPIVVDGDTYNTFEEYLTTIIQSKETVTTLVSNNNGTYTYTSEDGTTTVIDVPADVANYFETILNEGPITIGGVVYNTFEDYLTHVIKANETITTLVNNNNGTYTYVSEDGTVTLIDIVGDVATYFEDILNQGPIVVDGDTYNTFEEYLTTIIQSKETVTTLVSNNNGTYTYTSEDGTTTVIDVPADVANYFETILNEGPITIGGVVYNTFEDYLTHVIKANETITTLVNNNNGTYTYVSEDGTVTLIDVVGDVATYFEDILNQGPIVVDGDTYNTFEEYLTTIIQSKETVTTLVSNNNGTYTYTSEDGTTTVIDVPADVANYFETILNEGPITIGGVVYNTFEDYLTHVIKANETITTLVNNNNGTYTYVSEDGTVTLIDVVGDVATYFEDILNQGPIVVDGDTYNTFEEYLTTIIQSKETVTTLVSNNNGTYTYTSEDGTTTVIDVPADVANYFETILNEGPITIGGVVYNTFEDYLTHVIKANETITTLVNNNNGTYTYVSEDGTVTLIDVVGDVATYFEDILNQGPIVVDGDTYNTFEEYLTTIIQSKETVTTLVSNNNGTYTYTSEDGTTTVIDVPADVANYFETILNEGPITIGGVVYNTFEDYLTHVIKANETITTLVNNNNGTYTYVSEDGTVTLIDVVGDVATYFEDILNQGPIVVDGDTYNTFEEYLTTIIQSKETVTTLVSNNNGTYTYTSEDGTTTVIDVPADVANYFETILNEGPITIGGVVYNTFEDYLTHVIKANETITTLVNNNNGTYTYVSEDGTVTLIDIVGDVATYFEDILNQGPIVVDGDTYNTFEEYLTHLVKSNETLTSLIYDETANKLIYKDEKGFVNEINLVELVRGAETITTLVDNGTSFTYTNEIGATTTVNLAAGAEGPAGPAGADGKSALEIWQEIPGNENKDESDFLAALKGDQGPAGPAGADGKSALEIWQEIPGNENKDESDFLAALKGDQGIQGIQGPKGEQGTGVNILGSFGNSSELPTTGSPGDAYLINGDLWVYTGGTPAYENVGNIQGPQGIQGVAGADGKSALEIWQEIPGNETKDESDFLAALKGDQGPQGIQGVAGADGKSALEIWQEVPGNETKDESDFLAALKGDQGIQGPEGPEGPSTPQTITHTLRSVDNILTSDVNGVAPTATIINSNTLELDANTNILTSTVNGVANTTPVDLSSLAVEPWNVQGGVNKAKSNTEDIYQMGKVAVGVSAFPTTPSSADVKLYVEGDVEVKGKFYTMNSVFADYVFEEYFEGESIINPNYSFNKLADVKQFIEENHHLPGVTSIGELKKTEDGYMIDYSKLTIQQLEKIEELFIHTIEQQDLIEIQRNEIETLKQKAKETNERLEKLEQMLLNVQKY